MSRKLIHPYLPDKSNLMTYSSKKVGFTLLELIIVIIIVGILATLGLNQYTIMIRKGRSGEARANIGLMRQLAYEYYLKNGSLDNIQNSDAGSGTLLPSTCANTHYFRYYVGIASAGYLRLYARRCTAGGKEPNDSLDWDIRGMYYPNTGGTEWLCYNYDTSSVFPCP